MTKKSSVTLSKLSNTKTGIYNNKRMKVSCVEEFKTLF